MMECSRQNVTEVWSRLEHGQPKVRQGSVRVTTYCAGTSTDSKSQSPVTGSLIRAARRGFLLVGKGTRRRRSASPWECECVPHGPALGGARCLAAALPSVGAAGLCAPVVHSTAPGDALETRWRAIFPPVFAVLSSPCPTGRSCLPSTTRPGRLCVFHLGCLTKKAVRVILHRCCFWQL